MGATGSLIVRRLLHAIPVILIVATGVFVLLEVAPGDAVDAYLAHTGSGDAAMAEQLRQQLGLDQSPVGALPRLHGGAADPRPGLVGGRQRPRDRGHRVSGFPTRCC